jgi:hypothetical protein
MHALLAGTHDRGLRRLLQRLAGHTAVAGSLLLACSNPVACETEVRVVRPGAAYDADWRDLHSLEILKYVCQQDGLARNAQGVVIGTKYVCTRC